jgi:hypothetical protein
VFLERRAIFFFSNIFTVSLEPDVLKILLVDFIIIKKEPESIETGHAVV